MFRLSMRHIACSLVLSAGMLFAWQTGAQAQSKESLPTVHFAAIADPIMEAAVYPIIDGSVKSDKVNVVFKPLPIPGLIEALNSAQYEIVQVGVTIVPKIALAGAPIRIVGRDFTTVGDMATYGILVRADSDIRSLEDLKGRTLAVASLGATNTFQVRAVLQKKYGLDTFGGQRDVDIKEVPPPTMATLLRDKQIDAAYTFYAFIHRLMNDPAFRDLGSPQKEFSQVFDTKALIALKVSFAPILQEKGEAVKAALELLEESRKYYEANPSAIEEAVAKKYNVDPEYLAWGRKNTVIGGPLKPEALVRELESVWSMAAELGEIKSVPDVRKLIWSK